MEETYHTGADNSPEALDSEMIDVLARLEQEGVKAKPSDKLKDIASKLEKTPREGFAIIQGKD